MKRIICFACLSLTVLLLSVTALAKAQTVSIDFFEDKENTIELSLPSEYLYFTDDDIDKNEREIEELKQNR